MSVFDRRNVDHQSDLDRGADNLLLEAAGIGAGESCLLIQEESEELYHHSVTSVVAGRCRDLGIDVKVMTKPLIAHADEFPADVAEQMQIYDHTIFLSRLGDYVRFLELPGSGSKITSYTYDESLLASPYATISDTLMRQLLAKLEAELMAAKTWRIVCPLGTDLEGTFCWPSQQGGADDEILVELFPTSTFKPVPCDTASGTVALSRWLMPGGSPKVEQPGIDLQETVQCRIKDGVIHDFEGPADESRRVSEHYDRISRQLGINRDRVHSWHLGIHPQTFFDHDADAEFDRWCSVSFGSPRYLHFHTCGDEPPGEVTWSLFHCSVLIDGCHFWEDGEFVWLRRADNQQLIRQYPGAEILLGRSCSIGL